MSRSDLAGLLDRLDGQDAAVLTHAFACACCSERAITHLADRHGTGLLLRSAYGPAGPAGEAAEPPQIAASALERLEEEIVEGSAEAADVLRLVLAASREMQLRDPLEAARLASWAAKKVGYVGVETAALRIGCEAAELMCNAMRLAGEPEWGSQYPLFEVFRREVPAGMNGRYVRARALAMWAVGEHGEAEESLSLATSLFLEAGERGEEGTTLALEGLLRVEQGADAEGALLLLGGLAAMERGRRPWLEVRALLNLALATCRNDRPAAGRSILDHVHRSYDGDLSTSEALDVLWIEGKIYGACGRPEQAIHFLNEARRLALERQHLGELTLITLDLELERAVRGEEIDLAASAALADEVADLWLRTGHQGAAAVREILGTWLDHASIGACHQTAATALRMLIKSAEGPGLRPLPFT